MATTGEGNEGRVHVVAVRFCGAFDLDSVEMTADDLVGVPDRQCRVVIHVLGLGAGRRVRIQRELE